MKRPNPLPISCARFPVPICESEDRRKVLGWLGYNIGKWIYILTRGMIWKDIKSEAITLS